MAVEMKNVYIDQPAATDTTIYTCPANTTAKVVKCTVTNDTTTTATISFNKVPSGDSVGATNLILNLKVIGNKETYECPEVVGQILNASGFMSTIPEFADQLTVSLDVAEVI